jgi:AcrR family transcriptional regulator
MAGNLRPTELPVLGAPVERADAARNRQRILATAERLFARDGVACTSMDAIAAAAGVGKGTVFRRFGDRASLALAVLESSERDFQEAFIRGPAPLGPGAPPTERLIAFGRRMLDRFSDDGELLLAAQTAGTPARRLDTGPYAAYQTHVILLIREAAPELDAEYAADALLAPLSAGLILNQLQRGITLGRIADGWEQIVQRVLCTPDHRANRAKPRPTPLAHPRGITSLDA